MVGVDLFPRAAEPYEAVLPLDGLDKVLPEADVLVLTLPLTPESARILDRRRLGLLRSSAILVNISRGGTVDQAALTEALRERTLSGAVLDVFEEEPLPGTSPLWDLDNVLLTPHNSFVGEGNDKRRR